MSTDQEVFTFIGNALADIAPDGCSKLWFYANVSPENDHGLFKYNGIGTTGETIRLDLDPMVEADIFDKLVILKKYFSDDHRAAWKEIELLIDLETGAFNADFKY